MQHVEVAVIVQVDQAHSLVFSSWATNRFAVQQMLVYALQAFTKVQELDLGAMRGHRMINQLHNLLRTNPTVGMKDQIKGPLFQDACIERQFQIPYGIGVVGFLYKLGRPVTRYNARKLPARAPDQIGIGVVFNRIDERRKRDVATKSRLALLVETDRLG